MNEATYEAKVIDIEAQDLMPHRVQLSPLQARSLARSETVGFHVDLLADSGSRDWPTQLQYAAGCLEDLDQRLNDLQLALESLADFYVWHSPSESVTIVFFREGT